MRSKSGTREQPAGFSWRAVLRSAGIALLSSLSLLAVVGLIGHPTIAAGLDSMSNVASGSLEPSAYLYRLNGSGFFTIGLPSGSRPADVNVVSDGLNEQIGFSEPGLNRVGRVVYAPSLDYQIYLPIVERNYPLPLPPFAVQMYGSINATTGLTWVVASGAKWIRFPILWSTIEPVNTTPNNYAWASWDASIQAASDAGIHFIATIEINPSWAAARTSGPVTHTADLLEFIGAVVARYPQVTYWEFYNEPDRVGRFGLNGAGYAAMLRSVYPVVKAANPNAQVVMGGIAMDWFIEDGGPYDSQFLTNVVSACTGTCFDIAAFHYYPGFRARWEPYGREINGKAAFIRQILATHGYNRPLMNTEIGWPAATLTGSPELAAKYVPKTFVRTLASDLLVTSWFALTDVDSTAPGLLSPGWVPRPSFAAYQTLAALLGQAKYVRAIPPSETGAAQIEAYQFSVPGATDLKRLDVYWYDCPSMVTTITDCADKASLKINAARVGMIDKVGARTTLNDADDGSTDGKVTIPGGVGTSPIYIDYQP